MYEIVTTWLTKLIQLTLIEMHVNYRMQILGRLTKLTYIYIIAHIQQ